MNDESITVLDHGYVKLIETWGSDEHIIESARMSTQKGFEGWGPKHTKDCALVRSTITINKPAICTCETEPGDEKLLKYLWDNKHATPFEFAGMVLEIKAPIFVFREHQRHRTQSYNEMSARYTPLPNENYIPTIERLMMNSKKNKQAGTVKGADALTEIGAQDFRRMLNTQYRNQQDLYESALDWGVPKELARIHLPVGRYSKMRAQANLRNWLAFLTLREAPNAMWEIRQYAGIVSQFIMEAFPRTHALYAGGSSGPTFTGVDLGAKSSEHNVTSHNQSGGVTVGQVKL